MIDKVENLEFVESEALWGVAHPEHVALLLLSAVLLVPVQLDLQLEGPGTVRAPLPEEKKNNERQKSHPDILTWEGIL